MDKATITHVLERLGAERVERGLRAFHATDLAWRDIWERCFLGQALGVTHATLTKPGGLVVALNSVGRSQDWGVVAKAFDNDRRHLELLILEWLEANRVPQEAPHVPVSGVPLPV